MHPERECGGVPASDEEHLVHATWNRRFWGFQILAFADHTYLIDFSELTTNRLR